MGQVYIIHFSEPLAHARHYLGYVQSNHPTASWRRYKQHITGQGARITQVANERGIKMSITRVMANQTRKDERRLKNQKNTAHLCPVCRMERAQGRQVKISFSAPLAA